MRLIQWRFYCRYDYDYSRDIVRSSSGFQIYWNMPTFQCRKHAVNFTTVSDLWGIRQNYNDDFRGDVVALLYDPGLFPALLATTTGGIPVPRNGGVPQAGNLSIHLDRFRSELTRLIPTTTFRGKEFVTFTLRYLCHLNCHYSFTKNRNI